MSEHFKFSLCRVVEGANGPAADEEVAQGVVFSGGKVVLSWAGDGNPVSIYDSMAAMWGANGRDGRTRVFWGYNEAAHFKDRLPPLM
jgi:hypothetical protein